MAVLLGKDWSRRGGDTDSRDGRSGAPDLLSEAATRIGPTLDLTRTAREATEVAVPAFAAAATIVVSEPLLAGDDVAARQAGSAAVVRRLAARLAAQPVRSGHRQGPRSASVPGPSRRPK